MKIKSFVSIFFTLIMGVISLSGCHSSNSKNMTRLVEEVSFSSEVNEEYLLTNKEEEVSVNEEISSLEAINRDIEEEYHLDNKLTLNIISKVYALLTVDLSALGFEVYHVVNIANPSEQGLAYADLSKSYKERKTKYNSYTHKFDTTFERYYLEAGFIDFKINKPVSEIHLEATERMFEVEKEADYFSNISLVFMDTYRFNEHRTGHFVIDNQYVKYDFYGDNVNIYNYDVDASHFDLSLGAIYNYDINDYLFIPLDQIENYHYSLSSFIKAINPTSINNCLTSFLQKQEEAGYTESYNYTIFISVDTYNALTGSLGQRNSVNNLAIEAINNIDYDPSSQYLTINDNGTVVVNNIPVSPSTGKTYKDWIRDILIVAGGVTIAIVISVASLGSATAISGMILGAVGEYAMQTLFLQRNIDEVKWLKVGLAGVFGLIGGNIPLASSWGDFAVNALGSALLGGLESVTMSLIDGVKDGGTLLKAGMNGALTAAMFYGVRQLLFGKFAKVDPVMENGSVPKPVKHIRNNTTVVDECPTLEMVKNFSDDSITAVSKGVDKAGRQIVERTSKTIKISDSFTPSFNEISLAKNVTQPIKTVAKKVYDEVVESIEYFFEM